MAATWRWLCCLCGRLETGPGTRDDGAVAYHAHYRWRHCSAALVLS